MEMTFRLPARENRAWKGPQEYIFEDRMGTGSVIFEVLGVRHVRLPAYQDCSSKICAEQPFEISGVLGLRKT